MTAHFPRTSSLPTQSSQYWAKEKDRYLRQLLLADYRAAENRNAIVYFSRLSAGLNHQDPDDLSEVLEGLPEGVDEIDIILQTPGGSVDAVEKIIAVLRSRLKSYRVVVPSWAKSGGTAIAISSKEIVLGVNSELGPIDPQMPVTGVGMVPCEFVAKDPKMPFTVQQIAAANVARMRAMAQSLLESNMLKDKDPAAITQTIEKISSSTTYNSHGAVIDFSEAEALGLAVRWIPPDSETWRRAWLLYCCYDFDTRLRGYDKIIEGERFSIVREAATP